MVLHWRHGYWQLGETGETWHTLRQPTCRAVGHRWQRAQKAWVHACDGCANEATRLDTHICCVVCLNPRHVARSNGCRRARAPGFRARRCWARGCWARAPGCRARGCWARAWGYRARARACRALESAVHAMVRTRAASDGVVFGPQEAVFGVGADDLRRLAREV